VSAEVRHPLFARFLAFVSARAEGGEEDEIRRELLAGLTGRVVEIGAGTGPNFRLYPEAVAEVVAVEPETYLRAKAEEAAARSGRPVRVVDAVADRLPFENDAFDAAVAAQVLCSVPSQSGALAEIRRVVRPGGELRFYEHVRAENPAFRGFQRAADALFWTRSLGGCRTTRDSVAAIRAAGFEIVELDSGFHSSSWLTIMSAPYALGVARSP
jgi:ubiquinone/menaquinone biosynthesis C-methylase UbiE